MTLSESEWFDKCPKAVLFEIARQFGMRLADEFTPEAGFATMVEEWELLHANGVVPQKPKTPRTDAEIVAAMPQALREKLGYASLRCQLTRNPRTMSQGTCDVCDASNVKVSRHVVTGIETYACAECSGEPPRRCETGKCDPGGECMNCGAWNGEVCSDPE